MRLLRRQSGGMRAMIVAALALSIAGCSSFGGAAPPPTYDLSAPTRFSGLHAPRGQLVVQGATAIGPLDSDKVVVRPNPDQVEALANAQWVAGLPHLVQVRMIQTFENARRLSAVGRPTDRITADYQLLLDIRAFEIDVAGGPTAQVTIAAKIVGDQSGRIMAARLFTARVPAAATQGADALAALDAAWSKVAVEIVTWAGRII